MPFCMRHGKKAWGNGKMAPEEQGKLHDPPLKPTADVGLLKTRKRLLKYGTPQLIVTSPFLRCRQTAEILSNGQIPIIVDPRLREFLGHWGTVQLDEVTENHLTNVKIIETFDELRARVAEIPLQEYFNDNTWIVSHGIVLSYLSGTSRHLKEGHYVYVKKEGEESVNSVSTDPVSGDPVITNPTPN